MYQHASTNALSYELGCLIRPLILRDLLRKYHHYPWLSLALSLSHTHTHSPTRTFSRTHNTHICAASFVGLAVSPSAQCLVDPPYLSPGSPLAMED